MGPRCIENKFFPPLFVRAVEGPGSGPEVCRLRTHKGTDRGRKSLALALALAREEPAKRTYFTCSETALIELQVGSAADLFSILSARGREIGVFMASRAKDQERGHESAGGRFVPIRAMLAQTHMRDM